MELKKRIKYFFIRKLIWLLIHILIKTCRLRVYGFEKVEELRQQKRPIIYAFWHRHIFVTIFRFKNTQARPLISMSEDGELVSQVAEEFGMNPVRGSSSRGGARAFLTLVNTIKGEGTEVLITADGPKGPARQVKDGIIRLAQKTSSAIIPVSWAASHEKVFDKTWDKFKIPLPFSKIYYTYGTPINVQENVAKEDYCRLRDMLNQAINSLDKK